MADLSSYINLAANTVQTSGTGGDLTLTGGNIYGANVTNSNAVSALTLTASGNISGGGNLDIDGEGRIGGNLVIVGNVDFSGGGSINQITSPYGVFTGNADGSNALYAGAPGYTPVPGAVAQFTGDGNAYLQVNAQNLNHGNVASMEIAITGDLGNDTQDYIDLGFSSSAWDGTQDNSLGTAVAARDGYLYVQGGGGGGNLVLGVTTAGKNIKFVAGGPNSGNIVANISSTGLNVTGNVTAGHLKGEAGNISNVQGANVSGAVGLATYASTANAVAGANVSGAVSYATTANSVAGANVSGAVSYATTANAVAAANVSGLGNIATVNLTGSTSNILYGNGVFAPASGGASIANGNSNVNIATANSNVTITAVGNTVVTVTGTGANITGTANISGNTYSGSNSTTGFILGNVNSKFGAVGSNSSIVMGTNIQVNPDQSAAATAGLQVGGGGYILAPNGARVFTLGTDGSATVTTNLSLPNGGNISVSTGNITVGGSLVRSNNMTQASWGSAGIGLKLIAATYTDNSTSAGTLAAQYIHSMGAPTFSFSNAVTVTNAATLYVNSPTAGTNATLSNAWAIYTNGNVGVLGTVSTPNMPAFRVYGTSSSDIAGGTTVTSTQGATVDYNQGSNYNNTTGIFTAPVAGLYSCTATLRIGGSNTLNQASIQKNSSSSGANVVAFWELTGNSSTQGFGHMSMAGIAKLAVGDTLRLQVISGNVQFDANDSYSVAFLG